MISDNSSKRWLILELAANISEWGAVTGSRGIVGLTSGVSDLPPDGAVPAAGESVCVLFCGKNALPLPAGLDAAFESPWQVWCHYGGDLNLGKVAKRWRDWGGLTEHAKQRLLPEGSPPPMPFSVGQALKWSEEFLSAKEAFKQASQNSGQWQRSGWQVVLRNLQEAWNKAGGQTSMHQQVQSLSRLLPAAMAARHLISVLSRHCNLSVPQAGALLRLYRSSGFPDYAPLFNGGPDDKLKKPYDDARHAFVMIGHTWRALTASESGENSSLTGPDIHANDLRSWLFKAHAGLNTFVALHQNDSQSVSSRLSDNPHSLPSA